MQNIKPSSQLLKRIGLLFLVGCQSVVQAETNKITATKNIEMPLTTAPISLSHEMRYISQFLREFNEATTQEVALEALNNLTESTYRASLIYPDKIAQSESEKLAYLQDLEQMQWLIENMMTLVNSHQLEQAKLLIKQLELIKDKAHQRYR